jgi:hypothetical protein
MINPPTDHLGCFEGGIHLRTGRLELSVQVKPGFALVIDQGHVRPFAEGDLRAQVETIDRQPE